MGIRKRRIKNRTIVRPPAIVAPKPSHAPSMGAQELRERAMLALRKTGQGTAFEHALKKFSPEDHHLIYEAILDLPKDSLSTVVLNLCSDRSETRMGMFQMLQARMVKKRGLNENRNSTR
ncbi:MAG: hypothetical protein JXB14_01840 [Candidatus Altiarchaeota archaeon]|nr:hypothetical protein [Candidatus Altiarchaeota archaeon]